MSWRESRLMVPRALCLWLARRLRSARDKPANCHPGNLQKGRINMRALFFRFCANAGDTGAEVIRVLASLAHWATLSAWSESA